MNTQLISTILISTFLLIGCGSGDGNYNQGSYADNINDNNNDKDKDDNNNDNDNDKDDNNDKDNDNDNNSDGKRKNQELNFHSEEISETFGVGDTLYLDNVFTTNSGLPLIYEIINFPGEIGKCKITGDDNNILQTIEEGICHLSIKQVGNATYLPFGTSDEIIVPKKCPVNQRPQLKEHGNPYYGYNCVPNYLSINALKHQPTASLGVPFVLKVYGFKLFPDVQLDIQMQGCKDVKVKNQNISTLRQFIGCTPTQLGTHNLTIKSKTGKTLLTTQVEVKDNAITANHVLKKTGVSKCASDTKTNVDCNDQSQLNTYYPYKQDGRVQAGIADEYQRITHHGDECIVDKATGLMWEAKTDDNGLQDKDWRYTYRNTNGSYNGGEIGFAGLPEHSKYCGNHLKLCNSQQYIAKLNANNYCGHNDWRLPFYDELLGLVDFGRTQSPYIHPLFTHIAQPAQKDKDGLNRFSTNYLTIPSNQGVNFADITAFNRAFIRGVGNYDGTTSFDNSQFKEKQPIHFYPVMAVRNN